MNNPIAGPGSARGQQLDVDGLLGGATMGALIVDALERFPNSCAFRSAHGDTTYRALAEQIGQALALFRTLGLRRGDVIAQLSGNRAQVYAVIAAAYIGGYCSTTLHAMGSREDHLFILQDSGAQILVTDAAHAARGRDMEASIDGLTWFSHEVAEDTPCFWSLAADTRPDPLEPVGTSEDIIRLAYTGGTTGVPKGVMLSNRALVTNTLLALAGMEWPEDIRFLCPTPISHGAGSMILPTLLRGGTFVLQSGFNPSAVLEAISRERISVTFLVPTMVYALLDHPACDATDFSSLHTLLYGAAPMSPTRIAEAIRRIGPVLCQGYGQTEAPNTILVLAREDHLAAATDRLSSAGRPYPGLDVRLLDDENREVPRGEVGELCVRGPLLMSGYWKRPDLTDEAFRGGCLHTGDMARKDADGFYYLVDRKRDLIISGGFNVFPGEVEKVLTEHPAVAAAAVIGVPDEKWGEAVKAAVVLRDGQSVSPGELIRFVRDRKGPVNTPKSVDFLDALPVTALGKPDKKALRARYWADQSRNIN